MFNRKKRFAGESRRLYKSVARFFAVIAAAWLLVCMASIFASRSYANCFSYYFFQPFRPNDKPDLIYLYVLSEGRNLTINVARQRCAIPKEEIFLPPGTLATHASRKRFTPGSTDPKPAPIWPPFQKQMARYAGGSFNLIVAANWFSLCGLSAVILLSFIAVLRRRSRNPAFPVICNSAKANDIT